MRVLAIGRPIGTELSFAVTLAIVDQMVDSVGPYRFQTEFAPSKNRSAKPRVSASPPLRMVNPAGHCQPVSKRTCHIDGVACITLGWEVLIRAINLVASRLSSVLLTISLTPLMSGKK